MTGTTTPRRRCKHCQGFLTLDEIEEDICPRAPGQGGHVAAPAEDRERRMAAERKRRR